MGSIVSPMFPERQGATVAERIEIIERVILDLEIQRRDLSIWSPEFKSLGARLTIARRRLAMLTEADR